MSKAVQFDRYGDVDELRIVEVDRPRPGRGQVLVRVKAAGINPGEAAIRKGLFHARWPATFPSGQGSDLAGIVAEVGPEAQGFAVGDEVIGFSEKRRSQAEYVTVGTGDLVRRPPHVPWEVAGALYVAGTTAYAAVRAVAPRPGETLVVSGAAGGVGSLAVQLGVHAGARVIGIASDSHHPWLTQHGVIPVAYGDGVAQRIRAEATGGKVDAFIDTFGDKYLDLALELGVSPERMDTIINFADAARYGAKTEGNAAAANAQVLGELAALVEQGVLDVPIAKVFPIERVKDAYRELERRHTLGKIVLQP
jgi:NADPH:quinone reductase-like Zn-dependent oxidoreductase